MPTTPDRSHHGRRRSRQGMPPADSSLDQSQSRWIRWLLACELPPAHIAIVLGLSDERVSSFLTRNAKWIGPAESARIIAMRAEGKSISAIAREIGRDREPIARIIARGGSAESSPAGPPRSRREGPPAIFAQSGTKVRRLHGLSYSADRIATILAIDPVAVRRFIDRLAAKALPTGKLSRALSDSGQAVTSHPPSMRITKTGAKRPTSPPHVAKRERSDPPLSEGLDEWGDLSPRAEVTEWAELRARTLDSAEAESRADDLAEAELPATPCVKATQEWDGPADWRPRGDRHGSAALTEDDVREILRLHAAGRSIRSLARAHGVNPGTVRAIVRGETWTHIARPHSPPPPVSMPAE